MGSTSSKSLSRRAINWLQSKSEQMESQMDADIARQIAKKQADAGEGGFTDPSARDYGFTRGYGRQHKADILQSHYLQQRAKSLGREDSEMPPDLIKFLTDSGPLEREVNKEFTSTRLLQKDGIVDQIERVDKKRRIRDMPLKGEEMDHTTRRTTNFGTSVQDVDVQDFGCRDWELYELLQRKDSSDIAAFWNDVHKAKNVADELRLQQTELLQNAINFIEFPVIMKDKAEKTYVGIWPHDLKELTSDEELGHKYEVVTEDRVKLCVADFRAIDEKEAAEKLLLDGAR